MVQNVNLEKYAWLSVGAALTTIVLKFGAYLLTNSVGFLSDAAESTVNLAAAVVALLALRAVAKPADARFNQGRSKAEYLSAALEGTMIFVAAVVIIATAIRRIIIPEPVGKLGIGLVIMVAAAAVNAAVGTVLLSAGKKHRSPTLHSDGVHLMTDVITSAAVLIGVGLVWLTGWQILDPIVALLAGANNILQGSQLVRTALAGLLDVTLPDEQNAALTAVLRSYNGRGVAFHGLQTRQSGRSSFASVDMLVPDEWTVRAGHELSEEVAHAMHQAVPGLRAYIHLEPISDPLSYQDIPEGFVPIDGQPDTLFPAASRVH